MTHQWDEGDMFMDTTVSFCEVCGGARTRKRVAGLDYNSGNMMRVDMVGATEEGWKLDATTPAECPGHKRKDAAK